MKLRNKLAAIMVAAMLAFAGVGYAAWTFTKEVSDSATVVGKTTAAIEASGLRVTSGGNDVESLYLICDAPEGETGLNDGNGIYWSTENSNDVSKKITSLTLIGSVNESDEDILDFATYNGHFSSTATSAISGSWVNIASTSALDQTVVSASKNANVEYVWTLPAVEYANIPTSVAEVDALQAEVAAISLTFAFKFNVASVNQKEIAQ